MDKMTKAFLITVAAYIGIYVVVTIAEHIAWAIMGI